MNCLTFETPFIITTITTLTHSPTTQQITSTFPPHLLPRLLAPASCSPQHTHAASKLPFHLGTTSSPIRVHLATQPPRRCFISWSPLASPSSLIPRYHILAGAENGPSAHAHLPSSSSPIFSHHTTHYTQSTFHDIHPLPTSPPRSPPTKTYKTCGPPPSPLPAFSGPLTLTVFCVIPPRSCA